MRPEATHEVRSDTSSRSLAAGDAPQYLAGKREVDLYVRTYNTLLRSSGPIKVDTLVPAHLNIQSSLHSGAEEPVPDMGAFMYSTLRLPASIVSSQHILLGQSSWAFARNGYPNLESWIPVTAPGRRRRWYDDGAGTLAAFVASSSDLDDLMPTIVAWQIEWNKLRDLIERDSRLRTLLDAVVGDDTVVPDVEKEIRERLSIEEHDWLRLRAAWGDDFWPTLNRIGGEKKRLDDPDARRHLRWVLAQHPHLVDSHRA